MPIYEFLCTDCRRDFEALCRSADSPDVACPACGGRKLSRLISRFAVSRSLTPCGTPRSDAPASCRASAANGGCACCQTD